jgi:hypothetical protein
MYYAWPASNCLIKERLGLNVLPIKAMPFIAVSTVPSLNPIKLREIT